MSEKDMNKEVLDQFDRAIKALIEKKGLVEALMREEALGKLDDSQRKMIIQSLASGYWFPAAARSTSSPTQLNVPEVRYGYLDDFTTVNQGRFPKSRTRS